MKNNITIQSVSMFVMLTIAVIVGICTEASGQNSPSFKGDSGVRLLASRAGKHFGLGRINGEIVTFKSNRVGFVAIAETSEESMEKATQLALANVEMISKSKVRFRGVNSMTNCDWHRGEIFSHLYKGKFYTLLVCKK